MTLYHKKQPSTSASASSSTTTTADSLIIGHRPSHSPNVIIESTNWDVADLDSDAKLARAKGYPGSYLIGVYDPETRQVSLHPSPLLSVSRSIVPQATDGTDATSARVQSNFQTARRDLGELFGNRKQKLAMRNADRMKVDTAGMDEGILQGITDAVHESKPDTIAGAEATATSEYASRPIPTPHLDATSPEFVYPLVELFPPEIATNVNPSALLHAADLDHVKKLLPGPTFKSSWLQTRIWSRVLAHQRQDGEAPAGILKTSASPQKTQIKQLLYIAYLWSIRSLALASRSKILSDRKALKDKLKLGRRDESYVDPSAEALLDQILSLYCVKERQKGRIHLTPFADTKMLATICALCLHIDGFQLEPELIAKEMEIPPLKIKEVTKSLGCTTRYRQTVVDADASAGGGAGAGKKSKVMVLKCPVELPDGRSGQPPKR